jgi:UDP-glucose 4-epimerase
MKNILVTGGLGFIGSHICVELLKMKTTEGIYLYNVFIIDNLENSEYKTFNLILNTVLSDFQDEDLKYILNRLHVSIFDLCDKEKTSKFFEMNKINTIIHCAGKKAVGESVKMPLLYYESNLSITLNILENVEKYNIEEFIFSSSATVYGNCERNDSSKLSEHSEVGINITNPYGKTKYFQEEILKDFYNINKNLKCYILRYFNPVGCHPSGIIGENPTGTPNNLMPYIIRVAANNNTTTLFQEEVYKQITIFGKDYNTEDGTCLRDYIHVCDLARAHIDVLWHSNNEENIYIFNVGTGKGTSVKEMIHKFKDVNSLKTLNYVYGKKREGDLEITVCDNKKILELTPWTPKHDISDMVRHSWNYVKYNE